MLHACSVRFDVTEDLEKIWEASPAPMIGEVGLTSFRSDAKAQSTITEAGYLTCEVRTHMSPGSTHDVVRVCDDLE